MQCVIVRQSRKHFSLCIAQIHRVKDSYHYEITSLRSNFTTQVTSLKPLSCVANHTIGVYGINRMVVYRAVTRPRPLSPWVAIPLKCEVCYASEVLQSKVKLLTQWNAPCAMKYLALPNENKLIN